MPLLRPQVRNPVDAYQSLFQEKNPKYAASKNLDDVEWPVPFSQYLSEQWEKYVNSFDNVRVPRVVMRYEDMWRDPEDFMKEVLVFTGANKLCEVHAKVLRRCMARCGVADCVLVV